MSDDGLENAIQNIQRMEDELEQLKSELYCCCGRVNSNLIDKGIIDRSRPFLCGWTSNGTFEFPINDEDTSFPLRLVVRVGSNGSRKGMDGLSNPTFENQWTQDAVIVMEGRREALGSTTSDDLLPIRRWFDTLERSLALRTLATRAQDLIEFEIASDVNTGYSPETASDKALSGKKVK